MARIEVERNVPIKMRDDTILRADVYRPSEGGPFPVLLYRLAYNKSLAMPAGALVLNPINAADRGYAVVIQDCRGRFASDGDWIPFQFERNDGYDSVEWCAHQSWSNGKVGMYGSSYQGITTWQAVAAAPPHLEAAFVYLTSTNLYDGFTYRGGAFNLGFNLWYGQHLGWDTLRRLPTEEQGPAIEKISEVASNMCTAYLHVPLNGMRAYQDVAPYYYDWLAHKNYDEYWKEVSVEEKYSKIRVPIMQLAGWFDLLLMGHLKSFNEIKKRGATDRARQNQRIVIGPWTHGNYLSMTPSKIGDFELGPAAMPDAETLALRWFDFWLKGVDNGITNEPPVRIFVMGANAWRDEEDWPPRRAKKKKWYLHSGGQANTLHGDGVLSLEPPADEFPDTYVYDPVNPVPTVGGRTLMLPTDGFHDQRCVEERQDVLVYSSPLLMSDIEVTGPVVLKLWAASSASDTDFTGKLVDVYPDGYAAIIADGILRVRYRESMAKPKLLEPGRVYELTIDLVATSQVFKRGHRIRVEIGSSNFPLFDRNLNTGGDNASEEQMQTAIQTIYHDTKHASHIILHVI